MYREDHSGNYVMLKHQKKVATFYRKFQKYDKALEVLMSVYKTERKIYNSIRKEDEHITDIHEEDIKELEEEKSKEGKILS